VRDNGAGYEWGFFTDADDHLARRMAAVDAFDGDRRANQHDYVAALLPSLPFADRSFDLVLSSHLLFVYPDHLDYDAHLGCARELARVASREARIFPLVDTTTERWPHLDRPRGGGVGGAACRLRVHPGRVGDVRSPPVLSHSVLSSRPCPTP
jgi:hypothetical protein